MLALARHSLTFYDLLDKSAKRETVELQDGPHKLKVFRGSLTKLWNEVGASNAYYTQVRRHLEDMSCIVVLQRGAVGVESIVAVLRRPNSDEFTKPDLTKAVPPATMEQELENVKRNIGGINIPEALYEFQVRLERLEKQVREVAQNGKT